MRLLLLNDTFFGSAFEQAGAEVLRVGPGAETDLRIDPAESDLPEVLRKTGFEPDAVLQVDSIDRRVFFHGLEAIPAPVAFYAIDAPLNEFWQRSWAHGFDRVWVDQYEVWRRWTKESMDWVRWLPLAADEDIYHPPEREERDLDILFVGTLNPELRPKRSALIHRLQKMAKVTVADGGGRRALPPREVAALYRRARIVLNEKLFEGVNLRTFEAMACGALLLTEASPSLHRLFQPGKHLETFTPPEIERVARDLLRDEPRREALAQSGGQLVRQRHTTLVRAKAVLADLGKLTIRRERIEAPSRAEMAWGAWEASRKWPSLAGDVRWAEEYLRESADLLAVERRARFAAERGDPAGAYQLLAASGCTREAAALQLQVGASREAAGLLASEVGDPARLHLLLAREKAQGGNSFTAGFNRTGDQCLSWSAFEHALRAHTLQPGSREAVELLDRILVQQGAPEFAARVWQRYHAHRPEDLQAQQLLIERALQGGYLPRRREDRRELEEAGATAPTGTGSTAGRWS